MTISIDATWIPVNVKKVSALAEKGKPPRTWWIDADTGDTIPDWMGAESGYWSSHEGKYYFDREEAANACAFFPECLSHSKGEFAGTPFTLEPWEELLVMLPVFGWKHQSSGLRRFRKVYVEIPKKNGKSKFCAGLGVYMTFCDGEPGAEVVCAAADREQAAIVFEEARNMVEDCQELLDRATIYRRSIVYHETRSSFKVLSADARTKHGPNIQCLIFDELHAQADRELFETLEKGIAARRQPLIIMITTAGDDTESICYEQHEYAESVIKDGGDESFLPVLFNLSRTSDWTNPEVVASVNPCMGVTVKTDYIINEITSALKDPRKQNAFKRLHCNIWTQQSKLWIPVEQWDACKADIDLKLLIARACAGGLDLSSKTDLTSFVLAFKHMDNDPNDPYSRWTKDKPKDAENDPDVVILEPEKEMPGREAKKPARKFRINFSVTLVPFFWMPEASLTERIKTDRFGYDIMKDAGLLELTEGEIIDYDAIYDKIKEDLAPTYKLKAGEIGYDPWNATQLATALTKDGFHMIETPQTMNHLTEPSKVFEAMVKAKRIRHDGNKILRWCIENVAVKEDTSGNIKPVKPSKSKRIDGVVASVLALGRLLTMKEKSGAFAFWVKSKGEDRQ